MAAPAGFADPPDEELAPLGSELDTRMLALQSPAGFAYYALEGDYILAEHLLLLNELLVKVAAGEIKRLVINMPPRHGKSWLASRFFPAWYLGLNPTHQIMFASYSEDFAKDWGGAARDAMADHCGALFGYTTKKNEAAGKWSVIDAATGRYTGGGMQSAGIKGGFTGRGANLLIVDDPIKNDEEAFSSTIRDKVWKFWNSTAMTRLDDMDGAVIVIMTRWHHDDLCGRLEVQDKQGIGENWTVFNMPALCDDPATDPLGRGLGEALWPERWSAPHLRKIKLSRGSWVWGAMFMGRPTPLEGGMFKKSWVRYARWLGAQREGLVYAYGNRLRRVLFEDLLLFATVDLACTTKTESDYTVAVVFGLTPDGVLIVLDIEREQLEGPDIIPMLMRIHDRWNLDGLWIEAVQFQLSLVQDARRRGLPARAIYPKKDKVARALPATAAMEGGRILILEGQDWEEPFFLELFEFPHSKFKDQVDCFAYGEQIARKLRRTGRGGSASVGGAGDGRIPQRAPMNGEGQPLSRHQQRAAKAAKAARI